jgi:hypothetical protein
MKSLLLAAGIALLAITAPVTAGNLEKPDGKVILTVTGNIEAKNDGDSAVFDLDMLEALPKRTSELETPWTKGKVSFEGPLGSAFLDAIGAKGDTLLITALNDDTAEVPIEDFRKWPVILATRMNGERMPVREKGPIFVIYPFDQDPSLYNELYFNRSVWQVKSIEVR